MVNFAKKIADNSSSAYIKSAYATLGPVSSFSDVLLQLTSTQSTPANELAAEQVVHLCDGWRYISSAITSFLRNAQDESIHYAYYAELRAAMSLYAGTGIRIHQGKNYYIDRAGKQCIVTPRRNELRQLRTHTIVWDLWKRWTKRIDVCDLIQNGLRISPAVSLKSLIPGLALFSTDKMILEWGSDLIADPKVDKNERNIVSYTPSLTTKPLSHMTADDFEFVLSLCGLLLPAPSGLKNSLVFDAVLIQWLVQISIESKVPDNDPNRRANVEKERKRLIDELSISTGESKALLSELLIEPNQGQAKIFSYASSSSADPKSVISRAIFLLRFASLSARKNIGGQIPTTIEAWLMNWLDHIGVRSSSSDVDPFDLSNDLQMAIDGYAGVTFTTLPNELWESAHIEKTYTLSRADRSVAWSVLS